MKVCLASGSPQRRRLLQQLGVAYETAKVEIDERWDGAEPPGEYVRRMSVEKARAAAAIRAGDDLPLLAADTAVVIDDQVLGKAESTEDAARMLKQLSGGSHCVYTAVTLLAGAREETRLNISRVRMRTLDEKELLAYCRTGEPIGKAGGYAIQGRAAAFIEYLEGSYSGVMGLPLYDVAALLRHQDTGFIEP